MNKLTYRKEIELLNLLTIGIVVLLDQIYMIMLKLIHPIRIMVEILY